MWERLWGPVAEAGRLAVPKYFDLELHKYQGIATAESCLLRCHSALPSEPSSIGNVTWLSKRYNSRACCSTETIGKNKTIEAFHACNAWTTGGNTDTSRGAVVIQRCTLFVQ